MPQICEDVMGCPSAPRHGDSTDLREICKGINVRGGVGTAPPTNPYTRRHHHQETQSTRQRRTTQSHQGQAGTSVGATGMDVDQDPQEQGLPRARP